MTTNRTHALFAGVRADGDVTFLDMTVAGDAGHRGAALKRQLRALTAAGYATTIIVDGRPLGLAPNEARIPL